MSTATRAGEPVSSARSTPTAVNRPSPSASGHWMARSVGSKWRLRMNSMAAAHSNSKPQSQFTCRTQKNGRWSSSRSRSVPPPNAARKATTHTPTASRRLRAASIRPDRAKASVAVSSSSSRSTSLQE